jgi:hypothetical protein
VDIAPFLHAGENTLAALVWNMGEFAAVGQMSNQTAFVIQGDSTAEAVVNTNGTWRVLHDQAYSPCSTDAGSILRTYYVAGPGDQVDGSKYPWGWEEVGFNDQDWARAAGVAHPVTAGYGTDNQWTLVRRKIPFMEESSQRISTVRRAILGGLPLTVSANAFPITIPANRTAVILLDQTYNTVAFPQLIVSQGKGSKVRLTYAEALVDSQRRKGNRNDIENKVIIGDYDIFMPDGGNRRLFRPLWFRTYRYLQLDISTGDDPLVIDDLYGMYTGYPFREAASFACNDSSLQTLWRIGWRTARLCAGETYFDCPYYEQLQYEGDTRIQALISLYVSGDDRLMRKAIDDFFHSRVAEGLTQGRYPNNRLQVIPPFSLYWISMIHDYWMHRQDDSFIREKLFAIKGVLDWYENRIDLPKQMLGPMDWWNFVDWDTRFANGVPDGATDGNSSVLTLQLAYTLRDASEIFKYYGDSLAAWHYADLGKALTKSTYALCWDESKGVIANTPQKSSFSQHANIMGILTGSVPPERVKAVMDRILHDTSLSQCTFYYRFYLTRAMKQAGLADLYYSQLRPWKEMVANGLTTFAENPDPTRSDCHAWSASPVYDFLATICGIVPGSPGFRTVAIRPAMGELREVNGSMPHPDGLIRVHLQRKGSTGIHGEIELPPHTEGVFYWRGQEKPLHPGKQEMDL